MFVGFYYIPILQILASLIVCCYIYAPSSKNSESTIFETVSAILCILIYLSVRACVHIYYVHVCLGVCGICLSNQCHMPCMCWCTVCICSHFSRYINVHPAFQMVSERSIRIFNCYYYC